MLVCIYKFGIIQYMLKYKCIYICILSYYTYSGTEYSDSLFDHIPESYIVYLVIFTICTSPEGCFVHPKGEYSHCPPNRSMPNKYLVFGL